MNELEALALALEVEKNELKFYLKLARKARDEKARKMFLFLAKEEAEHWDLFEEKFVEELIEKCELPAVDKELVGKLVVEEPETLSEVDAVKVGMEQEKLTWEFYEKAAKEAEHENVKRLFEELARIEKTHYELLKAQYDAVMKTGIWMDYQDFSLEVD
ncbi:ferritin family protein [Thermococcus sp. Bubb.Bath]|uniref:ferritin-like domain-containing protein n=1 Tax=Thermococcus sp. Bubb.Bath TaxID=1638242 RepID=UPI00143AFE21|nr:ferritin family protein [Thermococcus sp. Bubb.Bath]NJF24172.1 rubrerythrin [Thermococcus sp. Bubb.Bath]